MITEMHQKFVKILKFLKIPGQEVKNVIFNLTLDGAGEMKCGKTVRKNKIFEILKTRCQKCKI